MAIERMVLSAEVPFWDNKRLCLELKEHSKILANADYRYLGTKGALYVKGPSIADIAKDLRTLGWTKVLYTDPTSKRLCRTDATWPIVIQAIHINPDNSAIEVKVEFANDDRAHIIKWGKAWQEFLDTKGFD